MTEIYSNDYPIALIYKMQIDIQRRLELEDKRFLNFLQLGRFVAAIDTAGIICDLKARIEAIERGVY